MEHDNDHHSKDGHDVEHGQHLQHVKPKFNDCANVSAPLQACNKFVATPADVTLSQYGPIATEQIFQ